MFTGIVQHKGVVRSLAKIAAGCRLILDRSGWEPPATLLAPGESVSVSGVCLTVVAVDGSTLAFDVIAETLSRSTLGELAVGDTVNLEHALTAMSPLGGHMVQGHVDGVAKIVRVQAGEDWRLTVRPPEALMDYIAPKGSVCLSGVSLTVAAVRRSDFDVALIPTTLDRTTLGDAVPGMRVNLEIDVIARTVVHFLKRREAMGGDVSGTGVSLASLAASGFLGDVGGDPADR